MILQICVGCSWVSLWRYLTLMTRSPNMSLGKSILVFDG